MKHGLEDILFYEEQKIKSPLLWLLVFGLIGYCIYSVISNPPHHFLSWLIISLVSFGLLFIVFSMKLKITVTNEYFTYRFSPFHRKWRKINLSDIKNFQVITYNKGGNFEGWGIRKGFKYNSYTLYSFRAIELSLKNGKTYLFTVQNEDDLVKILNLKGVAGKDIQN